MAYRCFKHTTGNDDPFGIKLRYQCWRTGNGDIEPHSKRFPTLAPMAQKSWKWWEGTAIQIVCWKHIQSYVKAGERITWIFPSHFSFLSEMSCQRQCLAKNVYKGWISI
jgi:hypothetical protein